ncbi:hypothetical protein F183_A51930 [Bryobacterales bacterium F-183]|nr:hypothetical protein F183_A51930 [Bryobacterales bacterium F-183]
MNQYTVEVKSPARGPKPLAVICGKKILTESPFVFEPQAGGRKKPRTIVCVYEGSAADVDAIQLWKVHANGRRSPMRCSARRNPVAPYIAVEIQ